MSAQTRDLARRRIGRYVVDGELGRGGMGVVYAAHDTHIDRRIALKLITPGLTADATFVARFEQEMRVAGALEHPHIVPVHEIGRSDGNLFIAMRLVDGEDLRAVLLREGRLAPERVGRIARQIGGALDAAHARGLVHRDVKPANVLLTGTGEDEHAYLVDFGLAREAAAQTQLTAPGEWIGTLDYAAPEQIAAVPLRPAADVYALGCVLFHALTGAPPFTGSAAHKIAAHTHDPLPSVGGPLAATVDPVLARATDKDPGRRHASAGELGRELAAALRGRAGARSRTRPAVAVVTAVGVVLAAVLATTLALRGDDPPRTSTATASTSPGTKTTEQRRARPAIVAPATASYTAPAGGYTAAVPADWADQGEQDLGGILRTVFAGPGGARLWIDATPRMPPTFSTTGRTGVRTDGYTTPVGTVRGYRFRGQPDFCAGGCLDDQLDLGGHGFAVMAGPTPQARLAARTAMRSLRPVAAAQAPPAAPTAATPPGKVKPGKAAKGKGHGKHDD